MIIMHKTYCKTILFTLFCCLLILISCNYTNPTNIKKDRFGIVEFSINAKWAKTLASDHSNVVYSSDYNQIMAFGISQHSFNGKNDLPASNQISGVISAYKHSDNIQNLKESNATLDNMHYNSITFIQKNSPSKGFAEKQNVFLVFIPDNQTLYYIYFSYSDVADVSEAVQIRDEILQSIKINTISK